MIRTVRAAGFAAVALTLAASAVWGGPLQAGNGNIAPAGEYMRHAGAVTEVAEFGLDTIDAAAAEAAPAEVAERIVQMVDAAVPRPRTLGELVDAYQGTETADQEQDCLASAVYFEARGEPIEGQMAVADVVLNRVASERYPDTICEVVEQPWQFSFVNATGSIPEANRSSEAWRNAVAIARIATANVGRKVSEDVLWYHADYVSPSWGRRLDRETKVGLHIFYS